jgi:hypothetical protein
LCGATFVAATAVAPAARATGFQEVGQDYVPRENNEVDLSGYFRARGAAEAWAVAVLGAAVEGELADDQAGATDLLQVQVHLARLVFEHAQLADLVCEPPCQLGIVAWLHPEEDEEAATDLTDGARIDADCCAADALH